MAAAMSGLQQFGDAGLQGALANTDAGLQKSYIQSDFGNRTLPDLNNAYAAKGTFYGGGRSVAGQRAFEDTTRQVGDIDMQLAKTLAGLRRSGILAATGVMV